MKAVVIENYGGKEELKEKRSCNAKSGKKSSDCKRSSNID